VTKNQQMWLALVALIALWLYWKQKKNPFGIPNQADPKNQLPLQQPGQPVDVFNTIVGQQGPTMSIGY